MTINVSLPALKNAKALVVGITNEHSNVYGCPALFRAQGANRQPSGRHGFGFVCAYLATPYARRLPVETLFVDGGVNIVA